MGGVYTGRLRCFFFMLLGKDGDGDGMTFWEFLKPSICLNWPACLYPA